MHPKKPGWSWEGSSFGLRIGEVYYTGRLPGTLVGGGGVWEGVMGRVELGWDTGDRYKVIVVTISGSSYVLGAIAW